MMGTVKQIDHTGTHLDVEVSDDLAASRGILFGALISLALWVVVGAMVWALYRWVPR